MMGIAPTMGMRIAIVAGRHKRVEAELQCGRKAQAGPEPSKRSEHVVGRPQRVVGKD